MKIDIETLKKTKGIGNKTLERIIEQHKIDNDIKSFESVYIPSDDYKVDKDINLWQGDCLQLMSHIPDKSVDMILADPPYLHVKGGMKSKKYNTGTWKPDSKMVQEMSDFDEELIFRFLDESRRVMKKTNMYVFCSKLQLEYYFKYITQNVGLKYDLLVWDKVKYSMKSTLFHTSDIEYIIRIYEDGVSLNKVLVDDGSKSDIQYYMKRIPAEQPRGKHPTVKPISLLEKLLKVSSKEGDIILDCFMGSGSTGVACKNTNRKFIGIELDEEYFNIAKKRINE